MLSGANFLILDEPTNHLDMESKEILENALNAYSGTLLYVSHDRYFVNKTAHKILELQGTTFTEYLGNYDYYFEKKQEQAAVTENRTQETIKEIGSEGKTDWALQKKQQSQRRKLENQLAKCEERIAELEGEIASIDAEFSKEDVATNSARLNELTAKRKAAQQELDDCYETWEQLSEAAEESC
jgi:ATP-binding cassette subfamily F protein 3